MSATAASGRGGPGPAAFLPVHFLLLSVGMVVILEHASLIAGALFLLDARFEFYGWVHGFVPYKKAHLLFYAALVACTGAYCALLYLCLYRERFPLRPEAPALFLRRRPLFLAAYAACVCVFLALALLPLPLVPVHLAPLAYVWLCLLLLPFLPVGKAPPRG